MKRITELGLGLGLLCCTLFGQAGNSGLKLRLSYLFSDNMVVQQNSILPVSGYAAPQTKVIVEAGWGQTQTTRTGKEGQWEVKIKVPAAVKGEQPRYRLTISSEKDTIRLNGILIGDVWICSGQSNMEMIIDSISAGYRGVINRKAVLADVRNPLIRLFKADRSWSDVPATDLKGKWLLCEPEPARWYSATAYFFAKNLVEKLEYPIGLVNLSWGGAACQSFIKQQDLLNDSVLKAYVLRQYGEDDIKNNPHYLPSKLYNGMIHPVTNFPIKGAIWYQGEANRINYYDYSRMLTTMIKNWRHDWGQGDFPFYFVEIAPYLYEPYSSGDTPGNYTAALLREQQQKTLSCPNTGLATTIDIGEPYDIHPRNKQDVGKRLALLALKNTYGIEVTDRGPQYQTCHSVDGQIIISFEPQSVSDGLMLVDHTPTGFMIAGEDRVFVPAQAETDGKSIRVFSAKVKKPVAVRYGFSDAPFATLFGRNGLPAPAFRTDNWNKVSFDMDELNGTLVEKHFSASYVKTVNTDYLLYLPEGYDSSRVYPLMVFLHGSGERGDNPNQIRVHGFPKAIVQGTRFDFILVAPQCKTGTDWQSENLYHLIKGVISTYPIDSNRVYLTGMSMGGTGTWDLAFDYPDLFAAIAPVCGRINRNHPRKTESLKNMPVWAFHGELDDVVPLEPAKKMIDDLKQLGAPVKMTIYPGVYHNSFDYAYKEEELYKWFMAQTRSAANRQNEVK